MLLFRKFLTFKDRLLEKKFLEQYNNSSIIQVRIAIVLGIFLYAIFAMLDSVIVGPLKSTIWMIRFFFVTPFLILFFILTFINPLKQYLQMIVSLAVLVGGVGILWMLAVIQPPSLYLYSQGLMLVLIFNYTFFRLRFYYATLNGFLLLGGFELVSLKINPLPLHVFINNNFFLVSASIIGMAVSYFFEKLQRDNFLSTVMLTRMAETDGLTGVMNRNSLVRALGIELQKLSRFHGTMTFCMLDLDGFKEVNDYFGHLKGDELLRHFGRILSAKFRATDLIGRLGGDEFGILLMELSDPQRIVEAFRNVKRDFLGIQTELKDKITFSVGCVIIKSSDLVEDELFYYSLADIALATSKKTKDTLCVIGPDKKILLLDRI